MKELDIYYLFERITYLTQVPIHVYDKEQAMLYPEADYMNRAIWDSPVVKEECTKKWKEPCGVFDHGEFHQIKYAYFIDTGHMYLLGPILVDRITVAEMRDLCQECGVKEGELQIKELGYSELYRALELVYHLVTGEVLDWLDAFEGSQSSLQKNSLRLSEVTEMFYHFDKSEQNHRHFSLEEERMAFDPIRNGDVDALMSFRDADSMERVGTMAKSGTKQVEYMVLSALTLAARAAMEGGLNPTVAYNMSDLYHQKLEVCKTYDDYIQVQQALMRDFAYRVAESKKARHGIYYIEQSEDYLINHMFQNIRISDIARELGMNESYLSRRFKEEKGISMKAYLTRERLKGASNMLKYSDYTYAQIAEYCCFPSQSRFGELFRKAYGVTPAEYRSKNKVGGISEK